MSLGARLRDVRIQRAVSLSGLAVRIGVSSGYIADVEAGLAVPSHETLETWARALEVPFYRLFFSRPEAAFTPRLSPPVSLVQPERSGPWDIFTILFEWLRQAARTLLGRENVPEERPGG